MTEASGFSAFGHRYLARAGVRGNRVAVVLDRGSLTLTGEAGLPVVWPLAGVARIRVGYEETKSGKYYQTLAWRIGEPRPIMLCPDRENLRAYAATIRALAAQLAAMHGLARVERGIGQVAALVLVALIGLLALAAVGIALFVIVNDPWWGRLILASVGSGLFGLIWWDYRANKRPKAVTDLAQLDRQLPR